MKNEKGKIIIPNLYKRILDYTKNTVKINLIKKRHENLILHCPVVNFMLFVENLTRQNFVKRLKTVIVLDPF